MDKNKIELGHYAKVLCYAFEVLGPCPKCNEIVLFTRDNNYLGVCPICNSHMQMDPKGQEYWCEPELDENGNVIGFYHSETGKHFVKKKKNPMERNKVDN